MWKKHPLALPADEASFHVWRLHELGRISMLRAFIAIGAGALLGLVPMLLLWAFAGVPLRWFMFGWMLAAGVLMMTSHSLLVWRCARNQRVIAALKAEGRLRVITHEEEP